jgi:outer membrane biosynthesis protein TonB
VYAASFGLVIVALITLIIGVFQSGLTFIWISIGSSVAAALFLAVGVLQKKPVQPATAGAPYGPPAGSTEAVDERETAVIETPAARRRVTAPPSRDEEEETAPPAPSRAKAAPRKKAPAKKAPAKKAAAKAAPKSTASKGAAKKSTAKAAATGGSVVAIPERGTYHQASCRFVKGRRDTEKMTKASAGRKGFTPCGVCRP